MNTHLLALQLMAAQGLLGAFDTLYHHELTEALAQRSSAYKELCIHATRAVIYSALFIGLSAWEWHGVWAVVLLSIFGIEIVLTLCDFIIEDKTRLLPATERVIHTVLAINGGAFIMLLALNVPVWFYQPTMFVWKPNGLLSMFLALCGIGVGLSGIRDALAAYHLKISKARDLRQSPIHFSDQAENVLVTGATGFIGQLLVRALLADGQIVTVLTRHPKKTAWLFDGRVRCIRDMNELPINYPVNVIINLAGERILGWRWTQARKNKLRNSRVELTEGLVAWIAKAQQKPKLFLSASAIGYYGVQSQGDNTELTEDSSPQSIFMSTLCQEWEAAAGNAGDFGTQVICMRFGLVLGSQGALPMMLLPIKLGLGGSLGGGKQWISWIHIHDLIRGIAFLIRRYDQHKNRFEKNIAYNFTAPESVTQKQFSRIAGEVYHRACFTPTPGFPMRLMLGEQADLLLEGQRVVPSRLIDDGFTFDYGDIKSALGALTLRYGN